MAEYIPTQREDHYIERDTGSSSGMWAVFAIILILLLLLLFRFNLFGRTAGTSSGSGTNVNGTVNTPSGTYQGSGTIQGQ